MNQNTKNVIYDTNYTDLVQKGGYPNFDISVLEQENQDEQKSTKKQENTVDTKSSEDAKNNEQTEQSETPINENEQKQPDNSGTDKDKKAQNKQKKLGFFEKIGAWIIGDTKKKSKPEEELSKEEQLNKNQLQNKRLDEQVKQLLNLPDDEYSDKMLTAELRRYILDTEKDYLSSLSDYKSHIAASYWEVKHSYFNISGVLGKTYYAINYPSYIDFLWTRDVLGFYGKWDMSWYIYPADDAAIQSMLKRRATQLKAEISESMNKGITIDSETEVQYRDVEEIRQKLATREERYFETSVYTTLYQSDEEKLEEEGRKYEQKIGGYGVRIKPANQRMDEGFNSTAPYCIDDLGIYRSMVTTSLAGSFPFISSDLIESSGILYGVNLHTGSLVIYDRFSGFVPNFNSVVLATSGAGKSFTVKLEILRYLMLGIDVLVIDPENEYKELCERVGGTYVNIAVNSDHYINPFDMPPEIEDIEYAEGDLLRTQIMNLIGLISVLIGGVNPEEEGLLDKAIQSTYSLKEITFEDESIEGKSLPVMGDLLNVLEGMEGGEKLAIKLSKYVTGTFGKLFNNVTNVNLNKGLTVFSIRDLDEALKTPAMYNVLNFIWAKVRSKKKKRLLAIDEAWIMMQHDVSANFLFGLIKRARKYGLGITTITQDIEDFVKSAYGKPIVSNSTMQILLKQSTVSIKSLDQIFGLSENEKQKLVACNVGEGLIFAGNQHVGVKILASPYEKDFITTDVK